MTRRELLLSSGLSLSLPFAAGSDQGKPARVLPGTAPLDWSGDLSERMMAGAHRFVERKITQSRALRGKYWHRDFSSPHAYAASVQPNRERFLKIIGAVDARVPLRWERFSEASDPPLVAETDRYRVYQVRWGVLDGVSAEGLLLEPKAAPSAFVVALPDADQTPEQIAGLALGGAADAQFARRLAENGCEVLVPVMIDRTTRWSGHPEIAQTDQTHREWIYRQAFHMGRHVIGYEVQKVMAAVDYWKGRAPAARIGVAGYGEGGLIAFYSAAADPRIDVALVSGYFTSREELWAEPIYRNVWSLLTEFGDAELATLIAPRSLTVEYSRGPDVTGHKGDLRTPDFPIVQAEFARIDALLPPGFQPKQLVSGPGGVPLGPMSAESMRPFAQALSVRTEMPISTVTPKDGRAAFDPGQRQKRQVRELEGHVQSLVRASARTREQFFLYKVMPELADETWTVELRRRTYSPARFMDAAKWYRGYFRNEVLGAFDEPLLAPNPRSRQIYDTANWSGYEITLDVWPDVFAWGILLVPKGLKPNERRPVVVCQHGRRGVPQEVVTGDNGYYHDFAARLADRGFITFAPHNLYRGEDRYRILSRKANGVKASLFSFITSQHEQILRWLGTLPMVDPKRIGFYGLSYGGETAVRVPPVLEGYALSICSGDFNSWTRKVAATDERFSFMYSIEWEMPYFDMGNTFDYAEMTYLMIDRPFMVERGHNDRVGRDQWVAHEYAKVKWLYTQLGIGDRTEIEYFNGGHTINGHGTFRFLHRHLDWPDKTGPA